jgi:hypothetical protein
MLEELLVFFGLMALLAVVGTIIIKLIGRRRGAAADPQVLEEIAGRLARLEQVTEATAVEVERIGEGQRFTTRLLADRQSESAR